MGNATNNLLARTIQINTDLNLLQVQSCCGFRILSTE